MVLNIRNMVCNNCVNALRRELEQLGHDVKEVGLGYAEIGEESLDEAQIARLNEVLSSLGFELIVDPGRKLVEEVKLEILRHLNEEEPCPMTLSHCIAAATRRDYKTASRIFSAIEGRTIEKFYVTAKVEKAKELLSYGDMPLTEIAYRLGYSSAAFLSRQFKQETGMTPSEYRNSRHDRRSLSDI